MTQYATTSVWPQQSNFQNVSAAFGEPSEQYGRQDYGWQEYYNFAQKLYSAGDAEQANLYYSYAQQLYNAALQAEQQPALEEQPMPAAEHGMPASDLTQRTPNAAYESHSSESGDEARESWEAYYNYAQQLFAAGYQQDAEAYYRHAQLLYGEAERQSGYPASTVTTSDSIAPQYAGYASDSYVPQPVVTVNPYVPESPSNAYAYGAGQNSVAPQPVVTVNPYVPESPSNAYGYDAGLNSIAPQPPAAANSYLPETPSNVYGYAAEQPAFAAAASAAQGMGAYAPSAANWAPWQAGGRAASGAGRPLRQRLKIWATVTLIAVPLLGITVIYALFSHYQDQLNQTAAEKMQDTGIVESAIVQPMVDALKPAFDKTIRLTAAAQPILYELSLRDTPPPDLYSKPEAPTPSSAPTPSVQPASITPDLPNAALPSPQVKIDDPNAAQPPSTTSPSPAAVEQDKAGIPDGMPSGIPSETPSAEPSATAPASAAVTEKESGDAKDTVLSSAVVRDETESSKAAAVKDEPASENRSLKKSSSGRHKRYVKRSRNRGRTATRDSSAQEKPQASSTKKRADKSGLSDDPMGNFSL